MKYSKVNGLDMSRGGKNFYVRGKPTKRWMDYLKDDMDRKGMIMAITVLMGEWQKNKYCADPGIRVEKRRRSK